MSMTSSMALAMAMGRQTERQSEGHREGKRGRWQCIEFIALEECGVRRADRNGLSRQGNAGGTVE